MTKKLRIVFGVLGNITTILSSLAPIPTFYRIYKRKDTENFSVLPYITTILCNLFWAWYALPFITSQNLLLFIISAIQVVLQSIYVIMFFIYAPPERKSRTTVMVVTTVILFAMDIIITMAFLRQSKRETFAGVIATISSILAYAAPLSIMVRHVLFYVFFTQKHDFSAGPCNQNQERRIHAVPPLLGHLLQRFYVDCLWYTWTRHLCHCKLIQKLLSSR
ncbi:bidirectional sugar transporter SWEET1 isoform X1 [Selaginella moellendorffii]|uniref:bidirectional sugar transporter SWEET1 isoform X1 n=1 Tax=Selaginella moellendorffii TaxID=88036 RepID=UPI000D1CA999|nr:bidirectional sugar transporter SWEET1 isoform X1 [Selaginella moellendorffii]|eukprot:XP_024542224.1 bidirectional sugar transporter SWEET1 isoform X1 [Selaginella moellendorffii]